MITRYQILIIGLMFLIFSINISASDCIEKAPEEWLMEVENLDENSDNIEIMYTIYCSYNNYLTTFQYSPENTMSIEMLDRIKQESEPWREKAFELLPKYLDHPDEYVRCMAAAALGFYRWPKSFDYMIKCPEDYVNIVLFAVLGDKRAVPYFLERYNKYKITSELKEPDIMDYDFNRAQCISILYHFASPELLPFVEEAEKDPHNHFYLNMLDKFRERIYKLYPETKPSQDE